MVKKTKKGKDRLDKFYHLAKDQGYRSRACFKLIQLAKKHDFLSKSRICIDLCAAPGGWSQVAQRNMPAGSQILAIDLCPIKPIPGVTCIQSDITTDKCRSLVRKELKGEKADCVLNDGAPNVGSSWVKDAFSQCELTLQACRIACDHLKNGGTFVTKVFRSSDYNSLLWVFNQLFNKVDATKPTASRNVSAEIFVICIGFKGGKIDPRFFDPKWVFMETIDPEEDKNMQSSKGSGASLSDLVKHQKKRHRDGYEWGDDLKILSAHEFIASPKPAEILVTYHRLSLDASGSEEISKHELTTNEIRELCADLKLLGKRDLSTLMKWRMRILRGREKAERSAKKAEIKAAENKKNEAPKEGVEGIVAGESKDVMGQDVDDAIAQFLNEDGASAEKASGDGGEESEVDEELEKDLAEQVQKKRREEKIELKKTMERQRKMEWRKKLSLGGGKEQEQQEEPLLFKLNARNVLALEDEDKYVTQQVSDEESEENLGRVPEDSDSDSELDRISKMEIDLAVGHQLRKAGLEDKYRNKMQRISKKKKETRRQKMIAAWSGELHAFNESIDQKAAALRDKADESGDDDSDICEDDLKQLRRLQDVLENGAEGIGGADSEALTALLDGGHPASVKDCIATHAADDSDQGGDDEESAAEGAIGPQKRPEAIGNTASSSSTALVPMDDEEDGEEALKAQRRASRWFSQDIFKGLSGKAGQLAGRGDNASDASDGDDAAINEFEDHDLPQLPLTDKEKRKLKRKREKEKLERLGKKPKANDDEKAPLEVAPLEAPRPLVTADGTVGNIRPKKPTDPQELAETMALGSLLVNSKKSRMELIDAAYNRWAFDRDETLPEWFTEDENKHNQPELPISKELMREFRAKLREINARPIRKVTEAKARKKRRLQKRLEKLRTTAMSLSDNTDISAAAKGRQMRKQVAQLARQEQKKPQVVAIKKGGGGNRTTKGKAPKGAKTKVVDKRMKSDRRGEKRAAKKNPMKHKQMLKKTMQKGTKSKNRRVREGRKSGKDA